MILPEDSKPKPKQQEEFYYANGEIPQGEFPFSAVMDGYYAEAGRRPNSTVPDNLNSAITKVLGEAGTYIQWIKESRYEKIVGQVLRGLFEGWGLTDFPRGFLIEEAEWSFKFATRYRSNMPIEDKARRSIEKEMLATRTTSDQIDTDAAIKYLVGGLVEPIEVRLIET